jgi:hypothetical protein
MSGALYDERLYRAISRSSRLSADDRDRRFDLKYLETIKIDPNAKEPTGQ